MNDQSIAMPDAVSLTETEPPKKRSRIRLHLIGAAVGILIFVTVIYEAGFTTILNSLSRVGWGFWVVVVLTGTRHLLRSVCLYAAVDAREDGFRLRDAIYARLGGEAAGVISFSGTVVSETTKGVLLRRWISLARSVAALTIDNLIYASTVMVMIVCAAVWLMLASFAGDERFRTAVILLCGLASAAFAGVLLTLRFRFKPAGFVLRRVSHRPFVPGFVRDRREKVYELEARIYEFYDGRRGAFLLMLLLNVAAHGVSVGEVYFILIMLGERASIFASFVIEALAKAINFAFTFVPGNLGIYEGGASVTLRNLGYTAAAGVALALIRRGSILLWTGVGILLVLTRSMTSRASVQDC